MTTRSHPFYSTESRPRSHITPKSYRPAIASLLFNPITKRIPS
ncbi:MAG: hypothetical protein RIM23_28450 [Coleofasciculus sp. G3-WIS-01]